MVEPGANGRYANRLYSPVWGRLGRLAGVGQMLGLRLGKESEPGSAARPCTLKAIRPGPRQRSWNGIVLGAVCHALVQSGPFRVPPTGEWARHGRLDTLGSMSQEINACVSLLSCSS